MFLEDHVKEKITDTMIEAGVHPSQFTGDDKESIIKEIAETAMGYDNHMKKMLRNIVIHTMCFTLGMILILLAIAIVALKKTSPDIFFLITMFLMLFISSSSGKKFKTLYRNMNVGITSLISREVLLKCAYRNIKMKGEKENETTTS